MGNLFDTKDDCQSVNSVDAYSIHQGRAYVVPFYTASVAAGSAESISFKTPAGSDIRLKPVRFAAVANTGLITVTEGAVMTSGNTRTPQNMNRRKANSSLVEVKSAATLTTAGTVLYYDSVGAGESTQNEDTGEAQELMLKADTTYSITINNIGSTTASVFYYTLRWIEK